MLGPLRCEAERLQDPAHSPPADRDTELLLKGNPKSIRGPDCDFELAQLWRLDDHDFVDPVGMICCPFPRSSGPISVVQVLESAEIEACNPAIDCAYCEWNTAGTGCISLPGSGTRDDVLAHREILGICRPEQDTQT